jgi:hypothetical protein
MVGWLLECLNPSTQAPLTRAKAVKALGEVVQADTRVLEAASVQAAVDRALQVCRLLRELCVCVVYMCVCVQ